MLGNSSKFRKDKCSSQFHPSTPQFVILFSLELIFQNTCVKSVYKLGNANLAKCIFPGFCVNTKAKQPDPFSTHPLNKVNKASIEMIFANTGIA